MNKADLMKLYDYGYWATTLILDKAETITDEQYMADVPGISHGSMHATLAHMVAAETIWRQRLFEGISPPKLLSAQDFAGLDELRAFWVMEELKMRNGLGPLTDDSLNQLVYYRTTGGREFVNTMGEILYHLTVHGVQHRAEAATALTSFGRSPGDVDMILFLRGWM